VYTCLGFIPLKEKKNFFAFLDILVYTCTSQNDMALEKRTLSIMTGNWLKKGERKKVHFDQKLERHCERLSLN
jgi:hypothetical protein